MTSAAMRFFDTAGFTVRTSSSSGGSTNRTRATVLSPHFLSVYIFVARNTYRNAVINIKAKLWKLSKFFYMMRVYCSLRSTYLTSIIISLVNSIAPFGKVSAHSASFSFKACAVFPRGRKLSDHVDKSAFLGAINFIFMFSVKFILAIWANFQNRLSSIRPALFRAILRDFISSGFVRFTACLASTTNSFSAVLASYCVITGERASSLLFEVRMKLNPANFTFIYLLKSYAHKFYYTTSEKYGAVILERFYTATGIMPELVE